jgi:uncharacterized protein
VRIFLPNGVAVTTDSPDIHQVLSAYFGREVRLARAAPADAQNLVLARHRDGVDASLASVGVTSEPVAPFFDLFPMTLLTTSTLARLAALAPQSQFDERRFRMNVIVDTSEPGFLENEWLGREVALGDAARLRVALPDPRCMVTTLAQGSLPHDSHVLRALAGHNPLRVGTGGAHPCAGMYAKVSACGTIRAGDRFSVSEVRPAATRDESVRR